jgi:hypothetical protein
MNIPKEAIERAWSGGWTGKWEHVPLEVGTLNWQEIALDPTFWQALHKALDWDDEEVEIKGIRRTVPAWEINSEEFCHLIYQGQSTEEFWKELLG